MNNKIKYGYDDVNIVPDITTNITHRQDCIVGNHFFAAPMSSVVSLENAQDFLDNGIVPVIPRSVSFSTREFMILDLAKVRKADEKHLKLIDAFIALSLDEARQIFLEHLTQILYKRQIRICIDVANGHMEALLDLIKEIKSKFGDSIVIMSGNIANPLTYQYYNDAGCDYVRCGIGGGAGCLTASNTGVYYPLFSLLKETYEVKQKINGKCKIIADGGIKGYCDIQKALLFADDVMLGSLLNKAIESAGKTTYGKSYFITKSGRKIINIFRTIWEYGKEVPKDKYNQALSRIKSGKLEVWKQFYGMSTKKAQIEMGNKTLKTSEGVQFRQKVEYSLKGFMDNELCYLRSAMSYTNSTTLRDYKNSEWVAKITIGHNK